METSTQRVTPIQGMYVPDSPIYGPGSMISSIMFEHLESFKAKTN